MVTIVHEVYGEKERRKLDESIVSHIKPVTETFDGEESRLRVVYSTARGPEDYINAHIEL